MEHNIGQEKAGVFAVSALEAARIRAANPDGQDLNDHDSSALEASGWNALQQALYDQFFDRAGRLKSLEVASALRAMTEEILRRSSAARTAIGEQRESLRIGRALYDDIVTELDNLVNVEYAGLKEAMDTARVPWTPGRGVQP